MRITGLTGAGLSGKHDRKGAGILRRGFVCCWACSKAFKGRLNGGKVVEGIQAVSPAPKFTGGLRSTQHQQTEDCCLVATQIEHGADAMFVLGNSRVTDGVGEGEIFKCMKSLPNLFFTEFEDRLATRALVAGVDQSVKRKRIVLY